MKKIPTVFMRDPEDMSRVTRVVNPACQWVLDGEGVPTRKYDGTCVMFDGANWFARREVKPGRQAPDGWIGVDHDDVTGKSVGWEPVAQSSFAKYVAEALAADQRVMDVYPHREPVAGATYELVGPKVNGNPERLTEHVLIRHGYWAAVDLREMESLPRDHDGLRTWLAAHPGWEGIVWHHADGRMAKLKRRDFPEELRRDGH